MDELTHIDMSALDRLTEWGGEELMVKMIRIFLENAPTRLEQIQEGWDFDDTEKVERGSHSLRSTAGNVGAMAVSELAARIEDLVVDGEVDTTKEFRAELEEKFQGACLELATIEQGLEA